MPEITFIPYVEGEPYDASSLNVKFNSVEAGLNAIPFTEQGDEALGIFQAPSLAGYMERTSSPQTPHLIAMEGRPFREGPPAVPYYQDGTPITFGRNLANTPWPLGIDAASPSPLEIDPSFWQVARVGASPTLPLEAHFHDNSIVVPSATPYAFPLFLRRSTALAQNAPFAEGLIVQANVEFNCLDWRQQSEYDPTDPDFTNSATRAYMVFCIQILSQYPTYPLGVPSDPRWYSVPRTIRFVSDKTIAKMGYENNGNPGDVINPDDPGTTYPQVTMSARYASSIDVPIRTVIRREDLVAAGFGTNLNLPPLLGVRVAVGKWEVGFGPVQPDSFITPPGGPGGGALEDFPYAGAPIPNGEGIREGRLGRGNLNLFPIHASRDVLSL